MFFQKLPQYVLTCAIGDISDMNLHRFRDVAKEQSGPVVCIGCNETPAFSFDHVSFMVS